MYLTGKEEKPSRAVELTEIICRKIAAIQDGTLNASFFWVGVLARKKPKMSSRWETFMLCYIKVLD